MNQALPEESLYSAKSIQKLNDLEAVRTRPGMYIGDPHAGSHLLGLEAIGCCFWEQPYRPIAALSLIVRSDGAYELTCEPGTLPVEQDMDGLYYTEKFFTILHTHHSAFTSRGVGYAAINFLSEQLAITIWREGAEYRHLFTRGVSAPPTIGEYHGEKRAERLVFKPDPEIFPVYSAEDHSKLDARLQQIAYLYPGMWVTFEDQCVGGTELTAKSWSRCCPDGFAALLREECTNPIFPEPLSIKGHELGVKVNVDLQWGLSAQEKVLSYCNLFPTRDGGTHLTGFRTGLTKVFASILKKNSPRTGDWLRAGLSVVVQVEVAMPTYGSASGEKLVSVDAKLAVERVVCQELPGLLQNRPNELATLLVHLEKIKSNKRQARTRRAKTKTLQPKLAPLGAYRDRLKLARSPKTAAQTLSSLAKSTSKKVLGALVENPNTPTTILLQLSSRYPESFLQNPLFLVWLLAEPSLLSTLPVEVIYLLLQRENFSKALWEQLSSYQQRVIESRLIEDRQTPQWLLVKLAESMDNRVRLIRHPSLTSQVACDLVAGLGQYAALQVAVDSKTPNYLLGVLAQNEDERVRACVAGNVNTPLPSLEKLATDASGVVRRMAAQNAATPRDCLSLLYRAGASRNLLGAAISEVSEPLSSEEITQLSKSGPFAVWLLHRLPPNVGVTPKTISSGGL